MDERRRRVGPPVAAVVGHLGHRSAGQGGVTGQQSAIERIDDRVVLYLRFFLELPEREIAIAIGRPPGTVKSRLSRATGRLRAVIEARYPELRPGEEAPRG